MPYLPAILSSGWFQNLARKPKMIVVECVLGCLLFTYTRAIRFPWSSMALWHGISRVMLFFLRLTASSRLCPAVQVVNALAGSDSYAPGVWRFFSRLHLTSTWLRLLKAFLFRFRLDSLSFSFGLRIPSPVRFLSSFDETLSFYVP